jgi:hypothetical protein
MTNNNSLPVSFSPGRKTPSSNPADWRDDDQITLKQARERIELTENPRFGRCTLRFDAASGVLPAIQIGESGVWLTTWGAVKQWRTDVGRKPKINKNGRKNKPKVQSVVTSP